MDSSRSCAAMGDSDTHKVGLVSHIVLPSIIAIFMMILFRRDLRLQMRFLGRPLRPVKAIIATILAVFGSRIGVVLLVLPILIPYLFFSKELGLSQSQILDFIEAPEEVKHVTEALSDWPLGGFCAVVIAPIVEELLLRGVLFLIFIRIMGKMWAILPTTILFVLLHYSTYPMGPIIVVVLGMTGLFAALVLLWTRHLRWAILFHSVSNATVLALHTLIE